MYSYKIQDFYEHIFLCVISLEKYFRLYLFLQDMHELTEINNRLYWMYIYTYIYIGIMICSLHVYLCIRFKILTGSLLLKHTMFF